MAKPRTESSFGPGLPINLKETVKKAAQESAEG